MDRVAVITDVHANLPAHEAVLDAIESMDVDAVYCGCAYRDQHDRELGEQSVPWTLKHTDPRSKEFMRGLPFDLGEKRLRLVHGSPRKVNEYLLADKPARTYERIAARADCDVLVFGHTHQPWIREYGDVLFVNCGSVGKPRDGDPRASFALLQLDDGDVTASINRVAYDAEAVAREVTAAGLASDTPRSWCSRREREDEMKYVLFVCTQNAGRSQIAEALFAKHAPDDLRAESAGAEPANACHPVVVEAMREIGIDLSTRRPKRLTLEMQLHADWAITLACGARCPYVPSVVEDWDVSDPAGRPIDEVRLIRDEIELRVKDLLENRIDEIREDRRQHMMRMGRLVPGLVDEFGGELTDEEIRQIADEMLDTYDEVPVRSFVMTLANRKARAILKERTGAAAPS
jgi:putative phosphoesterase